MNTIYKNVQQLNELITRGETIKAMELFYSQTVLMQENEEDPRVGKAFCIEHEQKNLNKVKDFELQIIHQAIDPSKNVVFTEMELRFTPLKGPRMKLREVSVQYWSNGLIEKEKFYYHSMKKVDPVDQPNTI